MENLAHYHLESDQLEIYLLKVILWEKFTLFFVKLELGHSFEQWLHITKSLLEKCTVLLGLLVVCFCHGCVDINNLIFAFGWLVAI